MPDTATFQLGHVSEAAIPAAAMMVKGFFEAAGRLPQPEDFDDADLGALWEAILSTHQRKLAVTKINVQRELREMGWQDAKAFAALKDLEASYVKLDEALAAIEEILSRKLRRQAERVCREALNDLKTVHNVQELIQRTERGMSDLASQSAEADHWVDLSDVKDTVTERLPTGIDDLDRVNGGLPVGELTIGGAATGMGKSAFASALALNVASQGFGVAYFSLEMGAAALLNRMASAQAYQAERLQSGRTPNPFYEDFELDRMDKAQLKRFLMARAEVQRLPIKVDDRRGRKLEQIRLGARRAKALFDRQGMPMKLLVVDHIGKVKPDRITGNRNNEVGETTECLAVVAGELGISVVALSQLKRRDERNPDQRPNLGDLRDSGNIEQDAHTVMLFYRPGRTNELNKDRGEEIDEADERRIARERFLFEVDIAKSRGGRIQRVPLFCEIGANIFLSKDDPRCALTAQGMAV